MLSKCSVILIFVKKKIDTLQNVSAGYGEKKEKKCLTVPHAVRLEIKRHTWCFYNESAEASPVSWGCSQLAVNQHPCLVGFCVTVIRMHSSLCWGLNVTSKEENFFSKKKNCMVHTI